MPFKNQLFGVQDTFPLIGDIIASYACITCIAAVQIHNSPFFWQTALSQAFNILRSFEELLDGIEYILRCMRHISTGQASNLSIRTVYNFREFTK